MACSRSATATSLSVRTEAAIMRTEVDGGGDPDRGTYGGGDPDGGRWRQRRCRQRRMEAATQMEARMATKAVTRMEAQTEEATEVVTRTEVARRWKVGAETRAS
jgi:hypothetical protein